MRLDKWHAIYNILITSLVAKHTPPTHKTTHHCCMDASLSIAANDIHHIFPRDEVMTVAERRQTFHPHPPKKTFSP